MGFAHDEGMGTGRSPRPRVVGQGNVAVGEARTLDAAGTAIADYYAFTGHPGWGSPISEADAIAENDRRVSPTRLRRTRPLLLLRQRRPDRRTRRPGAMTDRAPGAGRTAPLRLPRCRVHLQSVPGLLGQLRWRTRPCDLPLIADGRLRECNYVEPNRAPAGQVHTLRSKCLTVAYLGAESWTRARGGSAGSGDPTAARPSLRVIMAR